MRRRGSVTLIILATALLFGAALAVLFIIRGAKTRMDEAQNFGVASNPAGDAPFVKEWDAYSSQAIEMALSPGRPNEFLALTISGDIVRFDLHGAKLGSFDAPKKSERLVTDPTGRFPHLLVASRATKWTGAIDYTETTDLYLQALDQKGGEVWKVRLDPKRYATLEPLIVDLDGTGAPSILVSASKHILCYDARGNQRWSAELWHHPGTLAAADLDADGRIDLLAAPAPKKPIVRLGPRGEILSEWAPGDGPSRLRLERMGRALDVNGISVRQVFNTGTPGVHHALAFFMAGGAQMRESVLPGDVYPLSRTPVAPIDIDGSGTYQWAIVTGDGVVRIFTPQGQSLTSHPLGVRPRSMLVLPRANAADLLVVSANNGLHALRPVAAKMAGR